MERAKLDVAMIFKRLCIVDRLGPLVGTCTLLLMAGVVTHAPDPAQSTHKAPLYLPSANSHRKRIVLIPRKMPKLKEFLRNHRFDTNILLNHNLKTISLIPLPSPQTGNHCNLSPLPSPPSGPCQSDQPFA